MTLTESQKGQLIEDLQNKVDYEYNSWSPSINIWRAGEGYERELPCVVVDFIGSEGAMFRSFADWVGLIDDLRHEHAFCERELVNITVYAGKYHNSGAIRGRDYASEIIHRIRTRILAYWNDLLYNFNASIDRSFDMPIRDLTMFQEDVATKVHEFDLNVRLRTDVRWYKTLPQGADAEERAEKAYIIMNNKNNIRINTS